MIAALRVRALSLDLVDHGDTGGAGQRVSGIGIAMQEAAIIQHGLDQPLMHHHRAPAAT